MTEEAALEKKRYECLEDLEIGSATSKKLRELGFHTVESLAMGVNSQSAFMHAPPVHPRRRTAEDAADRPTFDDGKQHVG